MSSEGRSWTFFLNDMVEAVNRIQGRTANRTFEQFARDQDGVEIVAWNFQVLGEASTHIPHEIIESYPEIPWDDMRNRVVHGYFHLNRRILWDTAIVEVPPLASLLAATARDLGQG